MLLLGNENPKFAEPAGIGAPKPARGAAGRAESEAPNLGNEKEAVPAGCTNEAGSADAAEGTDAFA